MILGLPSMGYAQEIALFRLYGIDGYASLRYLFEEDTRTQEPEGKDRVRCVLFSKKSCTF